MHMLMHMLMTKTLNVSNRKSKVKLIYSHVNMYSIYVSVTSTCFVVRDAIVKIIYY